MDLVDNVVEFMDLFLGYIIVRNVFFLMIVLVVMIRILMEFVVYFLNFLCVDVSDFFVSNGGFFFVLVKGGIIYFYNVLGVLGYMMLYLYLLENFLYFVY